MQDDSEVLCSDFLVLRNFCSLIYLSSLCNLTGLSSLIFSKTSWSWWFDHQWHQNDQCRFFFVEWIIKNLNFHWYTGCPIDMLTTSDPILQFLKPHILKSKTCFKKFVKKAFRWHLETQQNPIESISKFNLSWCRNGWRSGGRNRCRFASQNPNTLVLKSTLSKGSLRFGAQTGTVL